MLIVGSKITMVLWICIATVMAVIFQGVDSNIGRTQYFQLNPTQARSFLQSSFTFKDTHCYEEDYCEENQNVCNDHESAVQQLCASSYVSCPSDRRCDTTIVCPDRITIECPDPCNSNPCKNFGTCNTKGAGYSCQCSLGFDENKDCGFDCRPGPADIVFVVDSSMSVNDSFEQSRTFVSRLVSRLPVGKKDFNFALITYTQQPRIEFSLDTYNSTALVLSAVKKLTKLKPGSTYTEPALAEAYRLLMGSRRTAYMFIIFINDGLSTDRAKAVQRSRYLKRQGVRIYTVGIGDDIEQQELLDIASESDDFDGFPHVFSWTQTEDCRSILMNQTINSECGNCTVNSDTDVVLMFDATLPTDDFELAKDAMLKLIEYLDILNADVNIGLASFGLHLKSEFFKNDNKCCDRCTLPTCVQRIESLPAQTANVTNVLYAASRNMSHLGPSRKFLVVFSSGHWQDIQKIQETIQKLNSRNITVLIVAIGNDADLDTILTVTLNANFVFFVDEISKAKQFKSLKSSIFRFQCSDNMFT